LKLVYLSYCFGVIEGDIIPKNFWSGTYKTIFILDYLTDPALRRRVRRGLLQGEQLHALARHVHYGKRGHADGRDFQQQMSRASCLVLILAAIIYWQILEIDSVLRHWDPAEDGIDLVLLNHIRACLQTITTKVLRRSATWHDSSQRIFHNALPDVGCVSAD
jgi:hypothetical protein